MSSCLWVIKIDENKLPFIYWRINFPKDMHIEMRKSWDSWKRQGGVSLLATEMQATLTGCLELCRLWRTCTANIWSTLVMEETPLQPLHPLLPNSLPWGTCICLSNAYHVVLKLQAHKTLWEHFFCRRKFTRVWMNLWLGTNPFVLQRLRVLNAPAIPMPRLLNAHRRRIPNTA